MPDSHALHRSLAARPLGRQALSAIFALEAPSLRTVRPRVRDVRPHHAELVVEGGVTIHVSERRFRRGRQRQDLR